MVIFKNHIHWAKHDLIHISKTAGLITILNFESLKWLRERESSLPREKYNQDHVVYAIFIQVSQI